MKTTKKIMMICCLMVMAAMGYAQQWETILSDTVSISSGFINEDNTMELVGYSGNYGAYFRVFGDGHYETTTFPAPEGKKLVLQTLTPLDDGGYFVSGRIMNNRLNDSGELKIMILDGDLNVVKEQTLQVAEGFLGFTDGAAAMDDDGTIVLLKTARREKPNFPSGSFESRGVLFRFTQSGDSLDCRYLLADPPDPICYIYQIERQKLINDPYSDQIIAVCAGQGGLQSLLYFDYDFNLANDYFIDDISLPELTSGKYVSEPHVGYWYNANEMLLAATQKDPDHYVNHPHLLVGKMNREGEIIEKTEINKPDTLFYAYGGMAYANDSTVYVSTRCHTVSWLDPFYPCLYLVSTELEVLGKVELWDELDYYPQAVFPTSDGGCVFFIIGDQLWIEPVQKIIRFSREDFNPIPCSVKEVPQEAIKASAYPNPAKDALNIDISGLPENEKHRIQITDALGHICMDRIIRGEGNVLTVGVASLPAGMYTYQIYNDKKTLSSGKFVKE
ncbi:MAG: T9SS type A sorting domain-containing protein [Bacteroidales bacterium]|nr:T9SS type A sorting domain-containing protein [Bacteroidales bacterium]